MDIEAETFKRSSQPMDWRYVEPMWVSCFTFVSVPLCFLFLFWLCWHGSPHNLSSIETNKGETLLNQLIARIMWMFCFTFCFSAYIWFIIFLLATLTWFPSWFGINLNGSENMHHKKISRVCYMLVWSAMVHIFSSSWFLQQPCSWCLGIMAAATI